MLLYGWTDGHVEHRQVVHQQTALPICRRSSVVFLLICQCSSSIVFNFDLSELHCFCSCSNMVKLRTTLFDRHGQYTT